MKLNIPFLPVLSLSVGIVGPAFAAEIACPDLSAAVQVAPCPSEEELRYIYNGYCGEDARMYAKGKDVDTCVRYENYRQLKNIALWEAGRGEFQAYVSCDLDPAAVKAAKPVKIVVGTANKLTRVACEYGDNITFVHRMRAACKVGGPAHGMGECSGVACKAECE